MEGLGAARSAMSRQSIFRTFKLCRGSSLGYYPPTVRRYVSKELVLPQKHAVPPSVFRLSPGFRETRVGPAD